MEGSLSTKPTWEEVFTSDTRPVPFSPFLYKQKEDMGAGQFSNSLLLSFTFTLGDNFVFIGDRENWGLTSFVKFPTSGFPISKFPSISRPSHCSYKKPKRGVLRVFFHLYGKEVCFFKY